MANDASQALGAPEVAGTLVSPRGLTKKMSMGTAGSQVGGLVGTLAATALTSKTAKKTPDMPSFGRSGYLAASETELILTKTSQLGWKPHTKGDALVRMPRGDVQSVDARAGQGALPSQAHVRRRRLVGVRDPAGQPQGGHGVHHRAGRHRELTPSRGRAHWIALPPISAASSHCHVGEPRTQA